MGNKPQKILVTRFSALGDIAMTIPVIKALLDQHKEVEIIYVSRENLSSLFLAIERLHFFSIDLENEHKGVLGLFKLFKELRKEKITAYADLHNVLRTHALRLFFFLSGIPVKRINKGRKEKKKLTRKKDKNKIQIKSTIQRYADVFRALGYPLSMPKNVFFPIKKESQKIGIAPFAQHQGKIYPLDKMKEIVRYFAQKNYSVILFGGGKKEKNILKEWQQIHANISVIYANSLAEEIKTMRELAFMISMDSANMHLASLAETAVFSIWGATHSYAGFLGYKQNKDYIIEQENLKCRPCSVYGNKPCYRKDYACLTELNPKEIINSIETILEQK